MQLIYEKKQHLALFTLNRPEVHNALSPELFQQFHDACEDFAHDPQLRVGVITGAGEKAFSAGADVNTWLPFVKQCRDKPWLLPTTPMRGMELDKPLIAALNGITVGGGLEMALACDLRIASEKARFCFPETKLGILPRLGGTVRLPRLVGSAAAAEMILTGKMIDAQQALAMGLVNRVLPPEEVLPAALEMAGQISRCAPLAVQAVKRCMRRTEGMSMEEALWCENALGMPLYETQDYEEGRSAFLEKRPPSFQAK
ncbi:MAG: enoyl-CoA hydratase/isomerase family protein [Desulfarculaceae bacterium]|nr:enoyl-CoA hydratase/isomerase family protein [Desulfarculaceae bacterium]MCF8071682.1 enoyl-CoA hydratase/isomerase family protein [Desulfarculaceae bacterium]MCF8102471.1 enoyl-CoA hydratase/isomerase family protein [Desulfarculaceae bacterium]MCF8116813.1 enoyl-CoA hydratase/isomerase family protein [Desulfarculaceae bacterium]